MSDDKRVLVVGRVVNGKALVDHIDRRNIIDPLADDFPTPELVELARDAHARARISSDDISEPMRAAIRAVMEWAVGRG